MRVVRLLAADPADFVTTPVETLHLSFEGIAGDRHAGATYLSDARSPWHPRGTPIANTRQLSLVSVEESAEVAALLGIPELDPRLLGANLVLSGFPELSFLPSGTRLQFPSGATIFVTEQNAPCVYPARKLADAHGEPRLAALFPKLALGRRGLVGIVEREGRVATGDAVETLPPRGRVTQRQAVPQPAP
ncbi:MAG: MOSC domain-containing protein [Proteobacteria bacterium]|nr:MOSC domain-containing protein [Pseudomonadota bacterium]